MDIQPNGLACWMPVAQSFGCPPHPSCPKANSSFRQLEPWWPWWSSEMCVECVAYSRPIRMHGMRKKQETLVPSRQHPPIKSKCELRRHCEDDFLPNVLPIPTKCHNLRNQEIFPIHWASFGCVTERGTYNSLVGHTFPSSCHHL